MSVVFGKWTDSLDDVVNAVSNGRKVLMVYSDQKTWEYCGKEVTTEICDDMVCEWNKYDHNYDFYIDYLVMNNFTEVDLPAGEYSVEMGVKVL